LWPDRLLAAYALGSLAHGGFSPLVSDVDFGLVLERPPTDDYPGRVRTLNEGGLAQGLRTGKIGRNHDAAGHFASMDATVPA
jgi:hypothetical protein